MPSVSPRALSKDSNQELRRLRSSAAKQPGSPEQSNLAECSSPPGTEPLYRLPAYRTRQQLNCSGEDALSRKPCMRGPITVRQAFYPYSTLSHPSNGTLSHGNSDEGKEGVGITPERGYMGSLRSPDDSEIPLFPFHWNYSSRGQSWFCLLLTGRTCASQLTALKLMLLN